LAIYRVSSTILDYHHELSGNIFDPRTATCSWFIQRQTPFSAT